MYGPCLLIEDILVRDAHFPGYFGGGHIVVIDQLEYLAAFMGKSFYQTRQFDKELRVVELAGGQLIYFECMEKAFMRLAFDFKMAQEVQAGIPAGNV